MRFISSTCILASLLGFFLILSKAVAVLRYCAAALLVCKESLLGTLALARSY